MKLSTFVRRAVFLPVLFILGVGALPAMAQGVGAIGGTVADSSGGVLPGVNVTLTVWSSGASNESTSRKTSCCVPPACE